MEGRDLTVDDLESLPDDLRYELWNGEIILTPPPTGLHQLALMDLVRAVGANQPDNYLAVHSVAVVVDERNVPFPDVVVLHARSAFNPLVPSRDVPLVGEVTSETSEQVDRDEKVRLYARAGIPHYWIIDLLAERITLTEFRLGSTDEYVQALRTDECVTLEQPWEITLDLAAWTEDRRDLIGRARRAG